LDEKKQSIQSVRHYLALLKKVCRIAYKEGHSERYFFCNFKLPKQEISAPKALTREEFVKVRDVDISVKRRPSLALTRDLFLFACYVGTAYTDTVSITRHNLFTDDEGNLWLKYHRKKNEYLARVKLLPEAIALLEKYRDESRETLLPAQDYHVLRANMKSLRVLAGIKTDIVYHPYRNTLRTITTDNGREFAAHLEITRLLSMRDKDKITVYFADAYSSWQKGACY